MATRPYETLTEAEWKQVDRIHEMLDDGELDDARRALDELMRQRPDHPDLRIEDATLKLEAGQSRQALAALAGAERSADPARFFFLRAMAHHELSRFAEAEADVLRALVVHPGDPAAHDLLSRSRDHLGDPEGAAEASEVAGRARPRELSRAARDERRRVRHARREVDRRSSRKDPREARRATRAGAAAAEHRNAHRGGPAFVT
jgi:predicted Zn-dependent protease